MRSCGREGQCFYLLLILSRNMLEFYNLRRAAKFVMRETHLLIRFTWRFSLIALALLWKADHLICHIFCYCFGQFFFY